MLSVKLYKTGYYQRTTWSLENDFYFLPRISFTGPEGGISPAAGSTYNFSHLAMTYSQKEGGITVNYGKPEGGNIKFTIVNSRCIGTISNYKIIEYWYGNVYNPTKSITINGTFNVPVLE